MKRILIASLAASSLIFGSASSADVPITNGSLPVNSRQFQETEPLWPQTDKPSINYTVRGGGDTIAAPAAIASDNGLCAQVDVACVSNTKSLFMRGYFGDCNLGEPAPCIQGLQARKVGATEWQTATVDEHINYKPDQTDIDAFVRSMNADAFWVAKHGAVLANAGIGTSYPANTKLGTPGSAGGPITYRLPGFENQAGTDRYLVDSRFEFHLFGVSENFDFKSQTPSNVWMSIRPFAESNSGGMPVQGYRKGETSGGMTGSVGSDFYTAYTLKGRTGLAAGFPNDTEFRLQVKVPASFSNWFHGRVNEPEVTVSPESSTVNLLSISGQPIREQITSASVDTSNPLFDSLVTDPAFGTYLKEQAAQGKPGGAGWGWSPDGGIDDMYLKWSKLFPEKAKGVGTVWSLSSMRSNNKCMSGNQGLQGLLFTNAMAYQASTPTFANGFLNYSVAGTHLDHEGKLFEGSYVFMMRDSVARCLYGFRDAPISGTVSVTSSDGQQQVAYTSVTNKDGWLKLRAEGFTFSNKTISAKLTQEPLKVVAKTITCIKGKTTKKVSGTAPKCPSGYKVKK